MLHEFSRYEGKMDKRLSVRSSADHVFGKLIILAIAALCTGCASSGLLTPKELTIVQEGNNAIVLLRITCELEDGTPVQAFTSNSPPTT